MDALTKLQEWYLAQCNGEWEHTYGVEISNCDNPGWLVSVDLADTNLSEKAFDTFRYGFVGEADTSGNDWVHCKVEDGKFKGAGGPKKLEELIEIFLRWAHAT